MYQVNPSLRHHGIIGQKWGVRRYQNPDGSLTAMGKLRYAYLTKDTLQSHKKLVNEAKKASGVEKRLTYDIIKKGSKFNRLAEDNESLGSRRKYVSILNMDNKQYLHDIDRIGIKNVDKAMRYELSAKRDLKVARGNEVAKYIINKYGDKSTEQAYKVFKKLTLFSAYDDDSEEPLPYNRNLSKEDRKIVEAMERNYQEAQIKVSSLFDNVLFKNAKTSDEIMSHFTKKGYDAIVNAEDLYVCTEYPLILLNPESSVDLSRKTSIDEAWADVNNKK